MRPRPLGAALAAVALAGVAAPSSGTARTVPHLFQVVSYAPLRVWDETAGIPFAMPEARRTVAYRVGGATYRGPWVPASVSRGSNTEILREIDRRVRQGSARVDGAFVDRRLTAGERRRVVQVADLHRDADVPAVTTGHPACAGLGRAQARAIAAGRVRRRAQVIPGTPGAIALRHQRSPSGTAVRRSGTALDRGGGIAGARTARLRPDGGIAEAARGDRAVAGVTSRAPARRAGASVRAVPPGGTAPTDETVRALRSPGAYPVADVVPRGAPRAAIDRRTRQVLHRLRPLDGPRRVRAPPRGPAPPRVGAARRRARRAPRRRAVARDRPSRPAPHGRAGLRPAEAGAHRPACRGHGARGTAAPGAGVGGDRAPPHPRRGRAVPRPARGRPDRPRRPAVPRARRGAGRPPGVVPGPGRPGADAGAARRGARDRVRGRGGAHPHPGRGGRPPVDPAATGPARPRGSTPAAGGAPRTGGTAWRCPGRT